MFTRGHLLGRWTPNSQIIRFQTHGLNVIWRLKVQGQVLPILLQGGRAKPVRNCEETGSVWIWWFYPWGKTAHVSGYFNRNTKTAMSMEHTMMMMMMTVVMMMMMMVVVMMMMMEEEEDYYNIWWLSWPWSGSSTAMFMGRYPEHCRLRNHDDNLSNLRGTSS